MGMPLKTFTLDQVASHTSPDNGVWLVVEGGVYDVTSFLDDHPGGKKILLGKAGKDATEQFNQFHSRKVLDKTAKQFLIGKAEQHEAPQAAECDEEDEDTTYFGDIVP